jgi:hypothetical protein
MYRPITDLGPNLPGFFLYISLDSSVHLRRINGTSNASKIQRKVEESRLSMYWVRQSLHIG